jgi:hypothetical protein
MKLKVYVIDFGVPSRMKKWGLSIGIPIALLIGGGAVAYASGLVTWSDGQTLHAADLNGNFAYLQSEIATLQSSVSTLQASSGVHVSTNCTYLTAVGGNAANSYSACVCGANEVAISGGGYVEGSARWIQGNSANGAEWDVACADAAGNRVQCTSAFVVCSP